MLYIVNSDYSIVGGTVLIGVYLTENEASLAAKEYIMEVSDVECIELIPFAGNNIIKEYLFIPRNTVEFEKLGPKIVTIFCVIPPEYSISEEYYDDITSAVSDFVLDQNETFGEML